MSNLPDPPIHTEDAEQRRQRLQQQARALPDAPGVYLMKDAVGVVIYVGKALRLPDRVGSYFVPSAASDIGDKKRPMLDLIAQFDFIECESEWEALLTENRLIKDIRPRFNARLTDDKTFPYLAITVREDFPGVFITRDPQNPAFRGSKIYGPFLSSFALRESIQLLQKVFKFRTCTLDIRDDDPKRRFFRPCLLYPIKQCTAPCGARVSKEAYRADIDRLIRFLDSKRSVLLREMKQDMHAASEAQDYERAAVLRDQIRALEKLNERGSIRDRWQPETEHLARLDPRRGLESLRKLLALDTPIRCIECIDIAHLQGGETVGSKVCFIDGRPLKSEYRRYRIQTVTNDDYSAIREVVSRRYREAAEGHELYPEVIVIDGGIGQLNAAMSAFEGSASKPPMVISLAKKEELIYVQGQSEPHRLSRSHAGLRLVQAIRDEAHRFAQHYHHILRRKKTLGE